MTSRVSSREPPGEFELLERYFFRPVRDPAVLVPAGDDAAVVDPGGPIAVTIDTLVAGVHFPAACPADALGHRVLAVNLSDLAAIGAEPRWATLALTLPAAEPAWLEALAGGLFALADRFGVTLIGGDLTRGPLTLTLQLSGPVGTPLLRGGGRPGDDVYATGTLGDAAAGLAAITAAAPDPGGTLRRRFLFPEPRVAEGRALAALAHAAIDVSDGLVADLGHVARASGCGAEVDVDALPLSDALVDAAGLERARELALTGGDDYELCFTAPPAAAARVQDALAALGTRVTRIGRLTGGGRVEWRLAGRPVTVAGAGYTHF